MYGEYWNLIDINNIVKSIKVLFDLNTIFDTSENIILICAIPLILILGFFLLFNVILRWRLKGVLSPQRSKGYKTSYFFKSRFFSFILWMFIILNELSLIYFLILKPIKSATQIYIDNFQPFKSTLFLLIYWIPAIAL